MAERVQAVLHFRKRERGKSAEGHTEFLQKRDGMTAVRKVTDSGDFRFRWNRRNTVTKEEGAQRGIPAPGFDGIHSKRG